MNHNNRKRLVALVAVRLAELPDRTSPPEHPDMMLVTAQEATDSVLAAINTMRQELREPAPHFDFTDDGRLFALPTWRRDDEVTIDRLLLVCVHVPPDVIEQWTDDQVKAADVWACSAYFHASDNDDVQVPPKPDFLPAEKPWEPSIPGTII